MQKKKKVISSAAKQRGGSSGDGPAPGTVKDVCAVIRMGVNDTAIAYALDTCLRAMFHTVYIVDANRGEAEYAGQPLIAALRAKRIKVIFLTSDVGIYNRMKTDYMVVDVPPDFSAMKEQTHGLIDHARVMWRQSKYRRFALAPTYEQGPSYANGFILLLHVFWCLMGLFVSRRFYRGTYMTLTVLRREADVIFVPEELALNRDKEPYVFGSKGCRSRAPPDRVGMGQFLYLVSRETLTLRIFVLMSIYCFVLLMPPLWWLVWPTNPTTNAWDFIPFLASLRDIVSNGRIAWYVIHGIIAAYFTSVYFDTMSFAFAFALPLYAPFFWVFFLYAKTFWRGYGGDAPKLNLPPMLPRAVEGASFTPVAPVVPEEGEATIPLATKEGDDAAEVDMDSQEDEEEEEEEQEEEETTAPSPKLRPQSRRHVSSSPAKDASGVVAAKSPKRVPKSVIKPAVVPE